MEHDVEDSIKEAVFNYLAEGKTIDNLFNLVDNAVYEYQEIALAFMTIKEE